MKNIFLLILAFTIGFGVKAQQIVDTVKTDTVKKKVLIEDSWSNKPQKNTKSNKSDHSIHHSNELDTTKVQFLNKDLIKVVDDENGTKLKFGKIGKVGYQEDRDTTKIRIGGKQINIIDGWHGTRVRIERVHPWDPQDEFFVDEEKGFRGHWAGFEMGVNGFTDEDYSTYPNEMNDFMELDQAKSLAVNLNFLQYDISLQKERNTIGLVTGLGLEWNNYRFDRNISLSSDGSGLIQPVELNSDWNVKKSKLTSLYLTVPLLMEFQIPVKYNTRRVHMSAGLVGGLRLGSHTKIKYRTNGNTHKDKDHDDFNLRTLRYAAQVRMGYRSLNFFATYGLTDLFEKNDGPVLNPFTVGITLVSF